MSISMKSLTSLIHPGASTQLVRISALRASTSISNSKGVARRASFPYVKSVFLFFHPARFLLSTPPAFFYREPMLTTSTRDPSIFLYVRTRCTRTTTIALPSRHLFSTNPVTLPQTRNAARLQPRTDVHHAERRTVGTSSLERGHSADPFTALLHRSPSPRIIPAKRKVQTNTHCSQHLTSVSPRPCARLQRLTKPTSPPYSLTTRTYTDPRP